jgi:hypothetical protein
LAKVSDNSSKITVTAIKTTTQTNKIGGDVSASKTSEVKTETKSN